jgi:hypothetical protein
MQKQKINREALREYQEWLELCKRIEHQTSGIPEETPEIKEKRIVKLQRNFSDFCHYYFPHYVQSKFGWFHIKAAKDITKDPNIFAVLEWPREHAKSVFVNVLLPMWLKAKGELSGMVLSSDNEEKAKGLLGDIQAELASNQRYINDYGAQVRSGDWKSGYFSTSDGCGFWSFGAGQSPRGIRKAAKRPNYGVIDDIDNKKRCKNKQLVKEVVNWILEDLYGALSIKGARLVIAGNRIHKYSVLAHIVGDVEPDDPKREGLYHLKVYAIEDKRRNKADAHSGGKPSWKERYSLQELLDKMTKMGYRAARREFFHEHIEDGDVFKPEHIVWHKPKRLHEYDELITYVDPSFKGTKTSDFKAIVLLGKHNKYIDVLWAWVRQANVRPMVVAHYDIDEMIMSDTTPGVFETKHAGFREVVCPHYMEANFIQDLLLDEYELEGEERDYQLRVRADKRKKPDKFSRIENLSPLFERHFVRFNEQMRKNPDMQTLIDQFLAFPNGADDGPDAVEGGVYYLQKRTRGPKSTANGRRMGKYQLNKHR